MTTILIIAFILIVGFILDRKYSCWMQSQKEYKNNCTAVRTPADPFIIASAQIPEKKMQISGRPVPPKQFGELYNMRFRHIKKYKRHVRKK